MAIKFCPFHSKISTRVSDIRSCSVAEQDADSVFVTLRRSLVQRSAESEWLARCVRVGPVVELDCIHGSAFSDEVVYHRFAITFELLILARNGCME